MTRKIWIKLYIEVLDDPKMGRLPDHLWRRAVELFLLAGKCGDDGRLPPVEEIAWSLHTDEASVLEDLRALEALGIVHAVDPQAWVVTNFRERQQSESSERVRRYRERVDHTECNGECNAACNGEVTAAPSTSTSSSGSDSFSEEEGEVQERGEPYDIPQTPAEADQHPDIRAFEAATGGRIPGASQYALVIDAVRLLRKRKGMDNRALVEYLTPFWLAWNSRKRKDGRPYDPGNITWLTEWALNGTIPPSGGAGEKETRSPRVPSPEATRRMLAEKDEKLKKAVPPPKEVQARIRGLTGQLAGKDVL